MLLTTMHACSLLMQLSIVRAYMYVGVCVCVRVCVCVCVGVYEAQLQSCVSIGNDFTGRCCCTQATVFRYS